MSAKKIRGYRLSDEAWLEIKRIAELAGSSEAAVIENWALGYRYVEGKNVWAGAEGKPIERLEVPKKSGGARREVVEDEPDELPPVVKKNVGALPAGVTTGANLGAPKKKAEHVMELDGKIPAREKTLAELRANAQPFDRARQIKK